MEVSNASLVASKRLWGHIDGSDVLAPDAGDAVRTEFKQKAQRAFSTIIMAVSTPQLYLVTNARSQRKSGISYVIISSVKHWQTNCS